MQLEPCDWERPPDLPRVSRTKPHGAGGPGDPLLPPRPSCATSMITRQPCDTPVPIVTSISFAHYSAGSHCSGCHTLGLFPPHFSHQNHHFLPKDRAPDFSPSPQPFPLHPTTAETSPCTCPEQHLCCCPAHSTLTPRAAALLHPNPAAAQPSEHLMPPFSPHPASKMPLSSSSALDYALSRLLLPDTRNLSSPKLQQNSILIAFVRDGAMPVKLPRLLRGRVGTNNSLKAPGVQRGALPH